MARDEPISGTPEELAREASRRARGLCERVVDAHVHLFPDGFYRALWAWFDAHAWSIRFRGSAEQVVEELARSGIGTMVALVYSHKPGAAVALNGFLAEACRADSRIVGVGTVLPGEPDARAIVREAIGVHRLRGIKLHCHVQQLAIDDPRVIEVLDECQELDVPAIVHAGRQPRAETGYGVDPFAVCSAARTERVLQKLPRLRLVVPHLGMDELDAYLDLLGRYPNLYLDTAMVCADYFEPAPDYARIARASSASSMGRIFRSRPTAPSASCR